MILKTQWHRNNVFPFYTNLVEFNGRVFSHLAFEGSAGTCLIKICPKHYCFSNSVLQPTPHQNITLYKFCIILSVFTIKPHFMFYLFQCFLTQFWPQDNTYYYKHNWQINFPFQPELFHKYQFCFPIFSSCCTYNSVLHFILQV